MVTPNFNTCYLCVLGGYLFNVPSAKSWERSSSNSLKLTGAVIKTASQQGKDLNVFLGFSDSAENQKAQKQALRCFICSFSHVIMFRQICDDSAGHFR